MNLVEVIRNFFRNASLSMKIFVSIIFLVIVGIIIFSIVQITRPSIVEKASIAITNFAETTDAPQNYYTYISDSIYNLIESKTGIEASSLQDAIIREGTYHEQVTANGKTATFIIDADSLHYSFEITMTWNESSVDQSDPDINIKCPHYVDVIYKDKKCIADDPYGQLERYLPHTEYLSDGQRYTVELRSYASRTYLAVIVPECMNQSMKDEAISNFKKWLKSIYLDPNDYDIEAMGKCL